MISAMHDVQSSYGGGNINESQLKEVFREVAAVAERVVQRAARPVLHGVVRHLVSDRRREHDQQAEAHRAGPERDRLRLRGRLAGGADGEERLVHRARPITWQGFGAPAVTKTGCEDGPVAEGTVTRSCSVTTNAAPILNSGAVSETVQHDSVLPLVTYTGNAGAYTVDQNVSIHCAASDPTPGSGVASSTCADLDVPAYTLALGSHTLSATAEDVAGNVGSNSTTFTVGVTSASLQSLVARFSTNPDVTTGLNDKLTAAAAAKNAKTRGNILDAFANQVRAQTGKALTAEQAQLLLALAQTLR